ncbi:hypothetical protein AMATHDRAFT_154582 [Amanita thiersii Skay4041]|uniref:GCF C-terminal domain-containing protein n=1 Tax=Amanita thiersii Skay4041 TaxID=703135 RepID=A0A2A9N889_9AGAR|nr:hypothetical protein AMATHDRAFT_154582 [Amanita thiersii Skay4041]
MDSQSPVIFKRTKSKPGGRTRQGSPEHGKEDKSPQSRDDSPSALALKVKNKVKKSQPKSKLSFGADDEAEGDGEVFQIKKSNLSRKLALGKSAAAVSLNLESTTTSSRGPTYDQAYLNELKANTPSARPVMPSNDTEMSIDVTETSVQSLQTLTIDGETGEAIIPTESSIKAAKERRERLRKMKITGEEDYVSLVVTRRADEPQGPHPDSRLVREEDELGEGDDEFAEYTSTQERIALGKKSRKVEAVRRREEMKELIEEAADEDEESMEWEQEQIRRGGRSTPDQHTSSHKVKQTYKPAPIPAMSPIPVLAPAIDRLAQQIAVLTTSHAKDTAALNTLAQEQEDVNKWEQELRSMVEKAEEKRSWFSSFREWIEGVANFLDAKYPSLEKLEDEYVSLLQERFDMISHRRQADDEDDLITVFGPLPTSNTDTTPNGTENPNISQLSKQERRLERIARRQRRQRKRNEELEEGFSTDSSLPPRDSMAYAEALKGLESRKKDVLSDVKAEEFRDPGKGRWKVWREKYAESYAGAWGGLGMVSVWEFWARLECVGWDCIQSSRSLDTFKWYKGLYDYSRPGSEGTKIEESDLGPDGDLVASMISTAVIPRLCKLVDSGVLDVYSGKHIRRMIDLAEEVEASIEDGNVKLQTLLKSTTAQFESAIINTEKLIARFTAASRTIPAFDPEAIPARRRFLTRRVKLLQNLLKWRKYTGERFSVGLLATKLVEDCFLEIAETGWEAGGEQLTRQVASMLPNELLPVRLKRQLSL